MTHYTYQDILNHITMPSQYLGTEINTVKKNPDKVKLRIALAFPDLYEIGTSHFGIQILYSILNGQMDISAERVFCPSMDMEQQLRAKKIPLLSLESGSPLKSFDIIGFSLLYELNYTNILTILELSQIPFLAEERDESFPLIIAGGPCACNPEPVAKIFDAIVFGDGEEVCLQMTQKFMECKKGGIPEKSEILKQWSFIEGVYIPSFFSDNIIKIDNTEIIVPAPRYENYKIITRAVVKDLNKAHFPENPVVPFGKPVHDRLRMEIGRGCTRGCRFCQAGMIYRPVRERHSDKIFDLLQKCICSTGYDDISLMSLSTGDYSGIQNLLENLMSNYHKQHIAVSFPSLRAGTLTSALMEQIKRVRKTGFTIAPEAGSQRLRNVINKNITEEQISETIHDAIKSGWKSIKLYFMIGLPTETDDDLIETINFIKNIRKIKGLEKSHFKINASFTTFIPKPHTPFQWAMQAPLEYSKEVISRFKKELQSRSIQVKWQQPETSRIEGLFARGDRKLTNLLMDAYGSGCRLDGWSDHFDYEKWVKSTENTDIDINFYTIRERCTDEPLAWDHMNSRIQKKFFMEEWFRSIEEKSTQDCRDGYCHECGVCDFKNIQPIFNKTEIRPEWIKPIEDGEEKHTQKIVVVYSKMDQGKYFGHLELVNIFLRAIRRTRIPIQFSKGFHPMPKISFEDPLPLGMESEEERFIISVDKDFDRKDMARQLALMLPEGITVKECRLVNQSLKDEKINRVLYSIELMDGYFSENILEDYLKCEKFNMIKTNKKGKTIIFNLKNIIEDIKLLDQKRLLLTTSAEPGKKLRPAEIIKNIFGLSQASIHQARIIKLSVRKGENVQTTDY
jgi:radical SAM family uncharacterized protein/radical SAM-linked protein